jgi:hypothetical protein
MKSNSQIGFIVALLVYVLVHPLGGGSIHFLETVNDTDAPFVSFETSKDEPYSLYQPFPGFRTKSIIQVGNNFWDVYGFFLVWEQDSYQGFYPHIGDIEGVFIFKSKTTKEIISVPLSHYFAFPRRYLPIPGSEPVFQYFSELGKHGTHDEKGMYPPHPLIPLYIHSAFGGGKVYDSIWFQNTNLFSGLKGAQDLKDNLAWIPQDSSVIWSRVDLITQALADTATFNNILESALSNQKYWSIEAWHEEHYYGGIDFSSIQLTYISEHFDPVLECSNFSYMFMMEPEPGLGESSPGITDLQSGEESSLVHFLVGLSLPNDVFWVNLNPWEPERIIDTHLAYTDAGKIMLEADFQMKKDFCKYENPCESDTGAEYWGLLDKKKNELVKNCMDKYPGEIESVDNVFFSAATRLWIVPDRITAYGDDEELYIVDAVLDIYSEPVYEHSTFSIEDQSGSVSQSCKEYLGEAAKEYGYYAKELEEEMILPLVVTEVNTGAQYEGLRQVYVSLALAQWYKSQYGSGHNLFSDFIDSYTIENLESRVSWSPQEIWDEYVISYKKGEYYCEKIYEEENYIKTKIYTSGGVDFGNIKDHIFIIERISSEMKEIISNVLRGPLMKKNDFYYAGNLMATYVGSVTGGQPPPTTTPPPSTEPPDNGNGPDGPTPDEPTPPPETEEPEDEEEQQKKEKVLVLILLATLALPVMIFLIWRVMAFARKNY